MQSFHPFRSDTSFICSLIQLYTASIHLFNWITRYFTCVFLFGLVYIFPMFWWFRFFSSLSPSDFACFIADMQVAITINVIHAAHITHIKQRMHSNETHQKPFNQPKLTEYLMHFVFTICILNSLSLSLSLCETFFCTFHSLPTPISAPSLHSVIVANFVISLSIVATHIYVVALSERFSICILSWPPTRLIWPTEFD